MHSNCHFTELCVVIINQFLASIVLKLLSSDLGRLSLCKQSEWAVLSFTHSLITVLMIAYSPLTPHQLIDHFLSTHIIETWLGYGSRLCNKLKSRCRLLILLLLIDICEAVLATSILSFLLSSLLNALKARFFNVEIAVNVGTLCGLVSFQFLISLVHSKQNLLAVWVCTSLSKLLLSANCGNRARNWVWRISLLHACEVFRLYNDSILLYYTRWMVRTGWVYIPDHSLVKCSAAYGM